MTEAYAGRPDQVRTVHRGLKWKIVYHAEEDKDLRKLLVKIGTRAWVEVGILQMIHKRRWRSTGSNGVQLADVRNQEDAARNCIDHWLAIEERRKNE